jgi:ribosomal protein L20A (L18A)
MKNFKVKYTIQTSSRYGKYNYTCIDTVKATNEKEAISIIKSEAGNKISFKRFKVLIKSAEEVDMSVEIHK